MIKKYMDTKIKIKPLSFQKAIQYQELRAFNINPLTDDPPMYEIVELFQESIEADIPNLNLKTFQELCLLTLAISLPEHSYDYSFKCSNTKAINFKKQTLKDQLNTLDINHKDYSIDQENLLDLIELEPTHKLCKNTVYGSINYETIVDDSIIYAYKDTHKPRELKVKHKIALEEFLEEGDRLVAIRSLDNLPTTKDPRNKLTPLTNQTPSTTYIIKELVTLTLHQTNNPNTQTIIEQYNKLLQESNSTILKKIKSLEVYQDKGTIIELVCLACTSQYQLNLGLEHFDLTPK